MCACILNFANFFERHLTEVESTANIVISIIYLERHELSKVNRISIEGKTNREYKLFIWQQRENP